MLLIREIDNILHHPPNSWYFELKMTLLIKKVNLHTFLLDNTPPVRRNTLYVSSCCAF